MSRQMKYYLKKKEMINQKRRLKYSLETNKITEEEFKERMEKIENE